MKIWILTEAYNDYDQHGEYFVAAFANKPTKEQLAKHDIHGEEADHVLNGGGRRNYEYNWYYLQEYELQ